MRSFAVFLLCPLVLAGCLTAATISPLRYYTIAPAPTVAPGTATAKSLGVRPIIGAKPYKTAIAYTEVERRLEYFQNAEWADLPATMLNRALVDGLLRLGVFSEVDDAANMPRPDLILTGELRRFEADYNRAAPAAIVEVSFTLRDTASGRGVWQGQLLAESPLTRSGTAAEAGAADDAVLAEVVAAMEAAVTDLVERATVEIGKAVPQ